MPDSTNNNITNEPGFVIEPDEERRVLVNDPDRNDDIQKETVIRIGQYLSDLTNAKVGSSTHENSYPIDRSVVERSTHDSTTGRPAALADAENSRTYVAREGATGTVIDGTLQQPDPGIIGLNDTWQRGETNERDVQDGHELLPGAVEQTSPVRTIQSAILSNNRFNTDLRLNETVAAGGRSAPRNGFNPTIRLPDPNSRAESLGKYNRGVEDTTYNNLAKIGMILSLRGSGEVGSNSSGYNPLNGGEEAKAILPSPAQLGIDRTEWEKLSVSDVMRQMSNADISDGALIDIAEKSWGVMNNIYDPFDGITATGMPILAFTLILAMLAVAELISTLVGLISPGKPVNAPTLHTNGRAVFGRWKSDLPGDAPRGSSFGPTLNFDFPPPVGEILGIHETAYPFGDSLKKGTYLFFGIEASASGVVGAAVGAAASSFGLGGLVEETPSAPGYNAVFCRAVMRSTLLIIDSMKQLASSPNFISGVKNFLNIFEVIKRSKLIAAINVFTTLGDNALRQSPADDVSSDGLIYTSKIDAIKNDDPGATISKSKLQGTNKLAWAGNRTHSSFLMPQTVFGLSIAIANSNNQGAFGGPGTQVLPAESWSKHHVAIVQPESPSSIASAGAKIPQVSDDPDGVSVENIEKLLEAEYVPFYMHDLRTNEIVSFHAFLTALNEDFAPGWETSDGYGRVDPVSIYKNTTRKINISFWIVSTGANDFNDMWTKINKLVTFVYPQFSRGRKLSVQDKWQFTMPFSQIMTSSPIIRLRIGDLVRSNYSRFNIARVFGLTDPDTKLDGSDINLEVNQAGLIALQGLFWSLKKAPWTRKEHMYVIKNDGVNIAADQGISLSVPIPVVGSSGEPAGQPWKIPMDLLPYYKLTAEGPATLSSQSSALSVNVSLGGGGGGGSEPDIPAGMFKIEAMTSSELHENYGYSFADLGRITKRIKDFEDNGGNAEKTKDRRYIVPTSMIDIAPLSKRKIIDEANLIATDAADSIVEFLNPEKNAIVKSFEETGGMGLACRVDSLSFDWLDQTMWETSTPGAVAPNRVKATMSFTAIHDIAPGLDHQGYNRGPIYPVGPWNTRIVRG